MKALWRGCLACSGCLPRGKAAAAAALLAGFELLAIMRRRKGMKLSTLRLARCASPRPWKREAMPAPCATLGCLYVLRSGEPTESE